MSPGEAWEAAAARLRRAVAAGTYAEAQAGLEQMRRALDSVQGTAERAALARQALDALAWARKAVLAARAQDAGRLARLRGLPAGYRAAGPPRRGWRLEA